MKTVLFSLILSVFTGVLQAAENVPFSIEPYRAAIDSSVQLGIRQEYERLTLFFKEQCRLHPGDPVYPFFLMLNYEAMMIDYETTDFERPFDSLAVVSENGFKRLQKHRCNQAWMNFFLGTLYVTQAAHELRFANYLTFTKDVLRGISLLNKSVEADSAIYDAYLYLGAFQYARVALTGWLPFADDEKGEAVDMIERARNHGLMSREVAVQVLIALHGHMGDVAGAESLAADFKRRYPENRAVYWLLGNVYLAEKRYADARAEFERLVPLVDKIPVIYAYNRFSLAAELARTCYESGDYKASIAWCEKILSYQNGDKRCQKYVKFARKYLSRGRKKLDAEK